METTKAILIVSSHLSDAQEIVSNNLHMPNSINSSINFAKYVIWHCKGDLNQKIDADKLFKEFMKTEFYKG